MKKIIFFFSLFLIAAVFFLFWKDFSQKREVFQNKEDQKKETFLAKEATEENLSAAEDNFSGKPPEISGWIAWWKESEGYLTAQKYKTKLSSISPGWLKINKKGELVETGKLNKFSIAQNLKSAGFSLYPMITTDLTGQELAALSKDEEKMKILSDQIIARLKAWKADGLDVDFENIDEEYREDFSRLILHFSQFLKANNLKFSVTIQAQTGKNDWEGIKGQDIALIGREAEEVRIMAYDRHGEFSEPGPITPLDWLADIIDYNLQFIPADKIVIGLPTYGYIWEENGKFLSFQFNDFMSFVRNKNFSENRDSESQEIKFEKATAIGWLSDSQAVQAKIAIARKKGLNRFCIWNLGGTDESLFDEKPKL